MSVPTFLSPSQKQQFTADADVRRDNWLQAIESLLVDVRGWLSDHPEWRVEESETEITEEALGGRYSAPVLEVTTPEGRIVLEPIARAVLGAQGRADLYAWPSLFRVMLLRTREGQWVVRTDSGVDWPFPWSKDVFLDLISRLLRAS